MVARSGRPTGARFGRSEAGYNLVVLVVMIAVLNIMIAKALPLWSAVIKREKEAELIFRGMQYAEAIRIYEMRTGTLPVKLEQLIEIEPRCIRQLWKNPLDENGAWELVPAGRGKQVRGQNPNQNPNSQRQGRNSLGDPSHPGDPSKPDPSLLWTPGNEEKRIGSFPIAGVKSPVGDRAFKSIVTNPSSLDGGSSEISEWQFTHELAKALVVPYDETNPVPASMNVEQRLKPWPPNVKPVYTPVVRGGTSAVKPGGGNQAGGGRGTQSGGGRGTQSGGGRGGG